MSRIDEALRRAALGETAVSGDVPSSVRHASDSVLEHYPLEKRTTAIDRESPRPPVPPRPGIDRTAAKAADVLRTFPEASLPRDGKLVLSEAIPAVAIEQYRRVAAALHELQVSRGLKTLLVTSAMPQEGKTLTIVNLALTLSESYKRRVLLIDADLRSPSVDKVLGMSNGRKGLSEALQTERGAPVVELSPQLTVLPSGRPDSNPLAALTSERMRTLLDESAARYDWILLDAPPVLLLPDAQVLSHLTRAVLLVIRAGSTPFPLVDKAIAEVGRESIVGTVLNSVEERALRPSYYGNYRPAAT